MCDIFTSLLVLSLLRDDWKIRKSSRNDHMGTLKFNEQQCPVIMTYFSSAVMKTSCISTSVNFVCETMELKLRRRKKKITANTSRPTKLGEDKLQSWLKGISFLCSTVPVPTSFTEQHYLLRTMLWNVSSSHSLVKQRLYHQIRDQNSAATYGVR